MCCLVWFLHPKSELQSWEFLAQGLSSCWSHSVGCSWSHLRSWLARHDAFPKQLPHVAVGRKAQFLSMHLSLQGFLSVLTTWQLVSPRVSHLREKDGISHDFYNSIFEVTFCHSHNIPMVIQVTLLPCGRRGHSLWHRRQGSLAASLGQALNIFCIDSEEELATDEPAMPQSKSNYPWVYYLPNLKENSQGPYFRWWFRGGSHSSRWLLKSPLLIKCYDPTIH